MSYKRNLTRYKIKKQFPWIKNCTMAFSLRPLHRLTTKMYTLSREDGKSLTVTNRTSEKELEKFKDGTEYFKIIYNQASLDGKPHAQTCTLDMFNSQ